MSDSTNHGAEGFDEAKSLKAPVKRILVVEDNEDVAESLRMVLAKRGHTVEIAENAERALLLFERSKYDLVITDFALGKMTGLDLARSIKSKASSQPIILVTAYGESLNLRKERLSDFVLVLGKPFSLQEIDGALARVFSV